MAQGGKRKGAGRKKGSKSKSTLEKEAALAIFRERTVRHADILFNAQLTIARGQTYLYKIEKQKIVGPKGGISYKPKRPEIVTSTYEIERYLEGLIPESDIEDDSSPGATYYYLTTKEPENNAINSMLDRVWGKATQSISGPDGGPIPISGVEIHVRK